VDRDLQTRQLVLLQPSFLFLLSMNPNVHVIGMVGLLVLFAVPITVHAQDVTEIPPPLFQLPEQEPPFDFGTDQELRESGLNRFITEADFGWRLKILGEDFIEFITFDPLQKAQLKLEFAQERQNEIDELNSKGLPIPEEYEQRRIQKLNEAIEIFNQREDTMFTETITSIETLREMAEFNQVRVLYSQLGTVLNSPQQVKDAFNSKVNSLDAFQENCIGEFNVDDFSLLSLDSSFEKLEEQCPRLEELEKKFGRDRIRQLVTSEP